MKSMIILSPEVGYESATFLAEKLNCPYENPYKTGKRNYLEYDYVLKYGFSRKIKANKIFNTTKAIELSKNKINTLEALKDTGFAVEYTLNKEIAKEWSPYGVVARNIINGSNGAGLSYCITPEEVEKTPAKFWTKYKHNTHEFRVNVWKNKVISVYEKETKNKVFKFNLFRGVEKQEQLVKLVQATHEKIGLDWYGLDVVRDYQGNLFILEINSAPILYPYTAHKLSLILKQELNNNEV